MADDTFPSARVIADSIYEGGPRLTTLEVQMHRFVLAEFNTHRVFSRNSASSRAIPVSKQLDRIVQSPAWPVSWPAEQKGMQGGEELPRRAEAVAEWASAERDAMRHAQVLTDLGLHKSVTNRVLEPYMRHVVVVTSTAWENFFALRLDTDAQPEIRVAAEAMRAAYDASEPTVFEAGRYVSEWHLPYVEGDAETVQQVHELFPDDIDFWTAITKVSAARCARTSYLTQDGKRDIIEDLRLYDRLVTERGGKTIHWSPLEHVATPWVANRQGAGPLEFKSISGSYVDVLTGHLPRVGNLLGWRSLRTEIEAKMGVRTFA